MSTTESVLSAGDGGATDAQLEIGIELQGEIPASLAGFVEIPVTVLVPGDSELDALAVPVSSLVALAEGGYAVEVVTGESSDGAATTRLVAVEPGLFADGFVSITADGVAEGDVVVVPS